MTVKLRVSAVLFAVVLIAAIWFQRQTLREARAERTRLQMTATEVPMAAPADLDEVEHLRQTTRDLPKLRNEIRQLRAQTNALEYLRTEHQRLLAQLARITNAPPRPQPTPEQGFVMRDTWADAGLATVESAIQTIFWALQSRNFDALAACLDVDHARKTGLVNATFGEWKAEALQELLSIGNTPAFRIVKIEFTSPDQVRAHVQAAVNGATLTFDLARHVQEWKFQR